MQSSQPQHSPNHPAFAGPSGSSMLLDLGLDGLPYLVTSMDNNGSWQPGHALPSTLPPTLILPPGIAARISHIEGLRTGDASTISIAPSYKALAVGSIYSGDFQVFVIGSDNKHTLLAIFLTDPQSGKREHY